MSIGGSSPLTRGKLCRTGSIRRCLGLIPAHAGKTLSTSPTSSQTWAHPRSRGENALAPRDESDTSGSSPLTRGKLFGESLESAAERLIPAHAGKTRELGVSTERLEAHPRSRGENIQTTVQTVTGWGSSPLTRGKRHHGVDRGLDEGLIPAHAGKTRTRWLRSWACPAHPRSRGENHFFSPPRRSSCGSSPLTRGKLLGFAFERTSAGLIPAHAGKTLRPSSPTSATEAHPRSRGENGVADICLMAFPGSSPLTRGKHVCKEPGQRINGLIPAHAGKTPRASHQSPTMQAHPRSRGENTS